MGCHSNNSYPVPAGINDKALANPSLYLYGCVVSEWKHRAVCKKKKLIKAEFIWSSLHTNSVQLIIKQQKSRRMEKGEVLTFYPSFDLTSALFSWSPSPLHAPNLRTRTMCNGAKQAIRKCIELLHLALNSNIFTADHHWIVKMQRMVLQTISAAYFWMRRPIKLWHGEETEVADVKRK